MVVIHILLFKVLKWGVIMAVVNEVKHIFEPNPLACGQAVLSMLSGVDVYDIIRLVATERETTLRDMKSALNALGISFCDTRVEVSEKSELPQIALLSLETPKCWHWSLYFGGKFYDPEYGVCDDFPPSARRYYWKING